MNLSQLSKELQQVAVTLRTLRTTYHKSSQAGGYSGGLAPSGVVAKLKELEKTVILQAVEFDLES